MADTIEEFKGEVQAMFEEAGELGSSNTDTKLVNKYGYENAVVDNISLKSYVFVGNQKANLILPHTAGKYNKRAFGKKECPIVERVVNCLMFQGRNTGKKTMAISHFLKTMEIINLLTNQNPIQVLLVAIQNSAIREDKCRTGRSTMSKPSSVDVPPYRALSKSIYYLCAGARKASLKSRKTFSEHLAEEIINAAKNLSSSYAIKKKDECERTAMASR